MAPVGANFDTTFSEVVKTCDRARIKTRQNAKMKTFDQTKKGKGLKGALKGDKEKEEKAKKLRQRSDVSSGALGSSDGNGPGETSDTGMSDTDGASPGAARSSVQASRERFLQKQRGGGNSEKGLDKTLSLQSGMDASGEESGAGSTKVGKKMATRSVDSRKAISKKDIDSLDRSKKLDTEEEQVNYILNTFFDNRLQQI